VTNEVDSLLAEPEYFFEELTVTASRTTQPAYNGIRLFVSP
jgi:hypothetical protein